MGIGGGRLGDGGRIGICARSSTQGGGAPRDVARVAARATSVVAGRCCGQARGCPPVQEATQPESLARRLLQRYGVVFRDLLARRVGRVVLAGSAGLLPAHGIRGENSRRTICFWFYRRAVCVTRGTGITARAQETAGELSRNQNFSRRSLESRGGDFAGAADRRRPVQLRGLSRRHRDSHGDGRETTDRQEPSAVEVGQARG